MAAPTGRSAGRPATVSKAPDKDNSGAGIPAAPTGLTARGKKEWARIWEAGKWLHRSQHYMLVLNYCQKLDEIQGYQKELDIMRKLPAPEKEGERLSVYKQANGSWAVYPQVRLIAEGRAHLLAMLGEMRMSPSHLPDIEELDEELEASRHRNRGRKVGE